MPIGGVDGDVRQAAASSRMQRICLGLAIALVLIFLASVAKFYHRGTGFTALIAFPEGNEDEAPALRAVPHEVVPAWGSYDGQFYAQRALDPLVRDPAVDRAMDLAPFRARRILFSWTAWLLGLRRPSWILEAYALQNVASWMLIAVLLTRWLPVRSPWTLAPWAACLFSHGLLWSVRFALLDGPSLLLTLLVIRFSEKGRYLASAALAGINGLGRETNLLGVLAQPLPQSRRDWARAGAAVVLTVLPMLIWEDYLRSIYRSTIFAGGDQFAVPGAAMIETLRRSIAMVRTSGLFSPAGLQLCLVASLMVQAIYLVLRREVHSPWWRIALGYIVLMLVIDRVLWDPATGAITRVMLPLTVAFNVLLGQEGRVSRFLPWFLAGNLHVVSSMWVLW
jgi:hypothetical protein